MIVVFWNQEDTVLCLHAKGHLKSNTGLLFCFGIIWIRTLILSTVMRFPYLHLFPVWSLTMAG